MPPKINCLVRNWQFVHGLFFQGCRNLGSLSQWNQEQQIIGRKIKTSWCCRFTETWGILQRAPALIPSLSASIDSVTWLGLIRINSTSSGNKKKYLMWRYSKWENAKREVEKYKLIETSWPCSLWNLVLCGVGFPVLSFPAIPGSWVFLF